MASLVPSRRAALAIAAAVIVAGGAYAAYWHIMAGKLRDGLEPWAEARRDEGYRVQWGEAELSGFPTAFRFRFAQASFGADRPVPATFSAPRLVVAAAAWNLRAWRFTAPDGARIVDALGTSGFDAATLEGSMALGAGAALDVAAGDLTGMGLAQGMHIAAAAAQIAQPATAPADHRDTALAASLRLNDLKLPLNVPSFGDRLAELAFAVQLKGRLPPAGSLAHALAVWRNDGGTIELQSLRLHWGAVLVDASGTLALDGDLQPEGAFTASIAGQDAAIDLAVESGTLQPGAAGAVKGVLSLLARPGADGEKTITAPLTLQQGRIFLGPAAIGTVPRIRWE